MSSRLIWGRLRFPLLRGRQENGIGGRRTRSDGRVAQNRRRDKKKDGAATLSKPVMYLCFLVSWLLFGLLACLLACLLHWLCFSSLFGRKKGLETAAGFRSKSPSVGSLPETGIYVTGRTVSAYPISCFVKFWLPVVLAYFLQVAWTPVP